MLVVLDCGVFLEWWVILIVCESVCLDVVDWCVLDVELCGDFGDLEGMGDVWVVVVVRVIVYWLDL